MSADWTENDGRDGSYPRPWVWWSTGDKDASWQVGVAVDRSGKQVAGEFSEEAYGDEEMPTFIDSICENPGGATGLQNAVLIVEAVNAWSDPVALRARLACLENPTKGKQE